MESVREAVESLNLTLVYGGFVLAGLLFCGLVFLFGGDHGDGGDGGGDHGGIPFLSPTSLALFVTSFGGFGLIFHNGLNVSPLRSVVYSATAGGISMAALTFVFYQIFIKSQTELKAEPVDGLLGEVYTGIPENGVGEIIYRTSRGRQRSMARSADGKEIPGGTSVRIERSSGPTLIVARADQPEN